MMDNGRIRAVAVLGLAVLLGLIASSVGKRDRNEILDEQFCQVYYTLPSGECSELRSRVRSEVRGNGTPTLELGNKDTQPAMVFLHGWPDTSAVWANQFAEFCGEDNEYFCVAPSWIDFHPDYPPAKQPTLYSRQRRDFLAVIEDLGLRDITFVVFDFGSILGYQMLHLYPDLFNKVISIDIPMRVGAPIAPYPDLKEYLPTYQQNNIEAFLSNDNDIMTQNMVTLVWAGMWMKLQEIMVPRFHSFSQTSFPLFHLCRMLVFPFTSGEPPSDIVCMKPTLFFLSVFLSSLHRM
jgi:pimeloyl-ACP methyl ester carboxylesterase